MPSFRKMPSLKKLGSSLKKLGSSKKLVDKNEEENMPVKQASSVVAPTSVVLVEPTPSTSVDSAEIIAAATAAGCPHFTATATAPAAGAVCPHPAAAPGVEQALQEFMTSAPGTTTQWPRAPADAKLKKLAFSRQQPNVDELLEKHAASIQTLKAKISDTNFATHDPTAKVPYDDLWLLRFLLSNGEEKAEHAVRATLKYRAENASLLAKCAEGEAHPQKQEMSKLSISEVYALPTLADEPVQLIRAGKSNVKRLMDTYPAEEVVAYMNYQKEEAFLLCDEATRRTRRLVKMVTVVDMHSSRFADNDQRFFKALGKASKDSELYYPQLLAITVGINVPGYLNLIWPIAKRLMPAKTLAKFRVCGARDTVTQSAVACPFATTVFTPDTLVEFLGGAGPTTAVLGPLHRPKVP